MEKIEEKQRKSKCLICKLIFSKKVVDITERIWYNNKAEKIRFGFKFNFIEI